MNRPPNHIDLTGTRIGMCTILGIDRVTDKYRVYWKCRCDCGNEFVRRGDLIKESSYLNCGCYNYKKQLERQQTHGYSHTKLYHILYGMKQRCNNEKDKEYFRYGGRGIKICEEWDTDCMSFIKWSIENGYKEGLSIERKDVNGNYEPSNCCWIPLNEQSNNTRRNINITYNDKTLNINQWARELGINKNTFWRYIQVKHYSIDYIIKNYNTTYSERGDVRSDKATTKL